MAKRKKNGYEAVLSSPEMFISESGSFNRLPISISVTGNRDGGKWVYKGELIDTSKDIIKALQKKTFTLKVARFVEGQVFVMRLIDCSLKDNTLAIDRVVFWRPIEQDMKDPDWKFDPKD